MPKKLSYKDVKQYIEKEDYTLLSDTYINAHAKLKVRCPKGHEYEVAFYCFKYGNRCPVCAGTKRLSYKYVKEYIEKENYTLLSKTYKNNNTKLKLRCPKDHEYKVRFSDFKSGVRCPICANKKRSEKRKLSYDYVRDYIKSYGYTLLSDSYKNSGSKLKIKCDKGHEYEAVWDSFKGGNRCPVCANIKNSENQRFPYDDVKNYIESFNYTLLSKSYKNTSTKLKVRCDKGHEYEVTFANFQSGWRCPVCAGNKKLSYDEVKQYIEKQCYTLLSDTYKNSKTKLRIRCDKGHEYEVTFGNFKYCGYRCPICNSLSTSSKAEIEVADLVKELLPENKVVCNDRTQIINPLTGYYLELDVFVPDLNKAIEFNGNYWHSLPDSIIRDKIKREQCQEKNIDLLIIDENEWMSDKEKQIKKIKVWLDS